MLRWDPALAVFQLGDQTRTMTRMPNEQFANGFANVVGQLGPALLGTLAGLEYAERRLHPPAMEPVREALGPLVDRLDDARTALRRVERDGDVPPALEGFARQLGTSADFAYEALIRFSEAQRDIGRVLEGMHFHHRAEATLYPLRRALPPVSRFFVEEAAASLLDTPEAFDPDPPREGTGIHNASNAPGERGGFSLYVPESYTRGEALPLVVALHGGSGHGADFLWTWLREARSRRCLLLAPTSQRSTWSLIGADIDTPQLHRMVEHVAEHWDVDRSRILLTGLSDGATFSLLCGLQEGSPFTALAPASGVLHPANFGNGNMSRAAGKRIYLIHGALDWMFPISLARSAAEELRAAGAELTFREIEDLSHTYPREENAKILDWFGVSAG
jgi:phospholipase/carboxylesterase